MESLSPDLHDALTTLRDAHATLRNKRTAEYHQLFYNALKEANTLFGCIIEPVISKALACYWLDHFSSTLVNAVNHFSYKDYIDHFIALAVRSNIVSELTKNPRAAKVAACVCMSRVLLKTEGHNHPDHENVGNLLQQWFDTSIPEETTTSVASTADYLYGTGTWALYGNELAWPEDAPNLFYSLNLPVVKREQHKNHTEPNPARPLPDDLSM